METPSIYQVQIEWQQLDTVAVDAAQIGLDQPFNSNLGDVFVCFSSAKYGLTQAPGCFECHLHIFHLAGYR